MTSLLFIASFRLNQNPGLVKKTRSQIRIYSSFFDTVHAIVANTNLFFIIRSCNLLLFSRYSHVFIRFSIFTFPILTLCFLIRKLFVSTLVYVELPSPLSFVSAETKRNPFLLPLLWLNFICLLFSSFIIQRGVERFRFYDLLLEHKTLLLPNTIDLSLLEKPSTRRFSFNNDSLKLLSVSSCRFWHGIDLLLDFVNHFNSSNYGHTIHLLIVSPETEDLSSVFANTSCPSHYFTYLGPIVGRDLASLYDDVDICVSSLGLSRRSTDSVSELKTREYLSHNKPVIGSSYDIAFPTTTSYYYALREPISYQSLISEVPGILEWYRNIPSNVMSLSHGKISMEAEAAKLFLV